MRNATAALVLLLTLLLLAPALAQPGGMGHGQGHAMRGMHASERAAHAAHEQDWANLSANAKAQGLARAEQARLFSAFTWANGNATGRYVSFGLAAATGVITDHAVRMGANNTTFFTSVTPTPFTGNGTPVVAGARLRLDGGNATLMAHNNPTGLFQYRGENLTVAFQLAPGATFSTESNRSVMVRSGNAHGHVILNGNGTLTAAGATVTATVNGMGGVLFAAHPADAPLASANLHAVRDAMGNQRVGGILSLVNANGNPVADAVHLGVHVRAREVANGRATLVVSSDDPTPRAVVLLLDSSVVNLSAPDVNLTVTLDGTRLPASADTVAVLEVGEARGVYSVTSAGDGAQIVVDLPGFSEHVIVVSTTNALPGGGVTPTGATPTPGGGGTMPTGASPTSGGTTPTGTSPTGSTPTPDEGSDDTPGPGVVVLLGALAAVALLGRRKR